MADNSKTEPWVILRLMGLVSAVSVFAVHSVGNVGNSKWFQSIAKQTSQKSHNFNSIQINS